MCGISGIILKKEKAFNLPVKISLMSSALAHRGPDGEGFAFGNKENVHPFASKDFPFPGETGSIPYIPGSVVNNESFPSAQFAFAHRRLSIIDLSERGHQPMCTSDKKVWITFNGEIYNYRELRAELEKSGCKFISDCDTEVVINAYKEWNTRCVERFNGMWSFCIYDSEKSQFFASRDRLGVKPFYYVDSADAFAFASEQKAFVKSEFVKASFNNTSAHNYLLNGLLETSGNNFFEGVKELWPGHNLVYSLSSHSYKTEKYYSLNITGTNDTLDEGQLISSVKEKLFDAVRLRMRSDVEVGACLSGGIDSSVICGIMAKNTSLPVSVFTSVFKSESFNEERYADIVTAFIKARPHKVEPSYNDFLKDIDNLVYSQDVPIWDTSTYAQYCVMQLAKENNIKVLIDGQGADELFAGYHHHFNPYWKSVKRESGLFSMLGEIGKASKTIPSPFKFYGKELLKENFKLNLSLYRKVFKEDFLAAGEILPLVKIFSTVNEQLKDDIERTRLKSFLKCEDRCGMWHSVESRTPFSDDVNLIDFMFSFDGCKKIKDGVLKHLLREAGKEVLPGDIYNRYDKRGFETPMQKWVSALKPGMISEIEEAEFDFLKSGTIQSLNPTIAAEAKLLFKLFILARWKRVFQKV